MFPTLLVSATALAAIVNAAALPRFPTAPRAVSSSSASHSVNNTSSYQQVVYWGQNDSERDLADYCQSTEGIDVLVLSFLSSYGSGNAPSGNFGSDCSTGQGACSSLEDAVKTCKAAGTKILVSLGGAGASGSVSSQSDGEQMAQDLWDSYANPSAASNKNADRPLGSQFVDGFDLDIESQDSANNANYKYMINKLRSLFASDSANTYYISGAPQCPIPKPNMGQMIQDAQFDMLFIQFYNNDPCSANAFSNGDKSDFNFDDWNTYAAKGASKGAKLFIGLPAGPDGATGDSSGEKYYLQPSDMMSLVNTYKSHSGFAGVMLWDAGNSDTVSDSGCHYSGEVASVLKNGKTC